MSEQHDLSAPIVPPSLTYYRIVLLTLDWTNSVIRVGLQSSDGALTYAMYEGALALTFMTALNTVNLSVSSLQRRILNRLAADGKLPPAQ